MPPKAGPEAPPMAHIAHKMDGRVRFKVPSKKGDTHFFAAVKERLEKSGKICTIDINPITGSILVTHNTDNDSIVRLAESGKSFKIELKEGKERAKHPHVSNNVVEGFKNLDEKLKSLTDGEIDLPLAAFLALLGAGIYDLARGNFAAPAWYTAFWYALNIFLKSQPDADKVEKVLVPLGMAD